MEPLPTGAGAVTSIGINALFLEPGISGGSETYLRGLVPALARLRPELRIAVFTTRAGVAALSESGWNAFADLVPVGVGRDSRGTRLVGELLSIPRLAAARGCSVLHSLANMGPLRSRVPSVLTVLDSTYMTTNTLGLVGTTALRRLVPRAVRAADARITISAAARQEISRALRVPERSLDVVHLGVDSPPEAPTSEERVRSHFGLGPGKVILSVGAYRPHKNQSILIRALTNVDEESLLVLVGPPARGRERLASLVAELNLSSRVRLLGTVSGSDLEGLRRIASCEVSPSLVEGFGLPPLEAMSRGVPVVCSDIPAHREIVADAGVFFDPLDADSAATAIRSAMRATRQSTEAGIARARLFTWERTARETLSVYERAASASLLHPGGGRSR